MNTIQLQGALRSCSLHVLLMIVSKALSRSGYGDVRFLDRRHSRQKSRFGGHELVCETTLGTRPLKIVVKVVRDSARIRHLDELAGTVIRMGADSGLLITPFHVTKTARSLLDKYGPVRTSVIDGAALAEWLQRLGIGVRGEADVDWAYFGELEEVSDRVLAFLSCLPA